MKKPISEQLVAAATELYSSQFVTGAGGNLSARTGKTTWISPSGFSFCDALAKDYSQVDILSSEVLSVGPRPSSELGMHLAIYREREDVEAIIHTHPPTTIALTSSGIDLKPMFADYYVYLGKNVPHLDYITVTTDELAIAVGKHFADFDCFGIVLRNHGVITVGKTVKEALYRTYSVEEQANIQWRALLVGSPRYLTGSECQRLDELDSEKYRRQQLSIAKSNLGGGE